MGAIQTDRGLNRPMVISPNFITFLNVNLPYLVPKIPSNQKLRWGPKGEMCPPEILVFLLQKCKENKEWKKMEGVGDKGKSARIFKVLSNLLFSVTTMRGQKI